MKCRIRTKTYICGNYKHVYMYPVLSTGGRGRRKRYKPTSEVQAAVNARHAEKRLEMILETNFDSNDYFFTSTYLPEKRPKNDTEAMKEAKNFIRRIKYRCKKKGLPDPKAVWCTELSKEHRLYHHHFVIKCGLSYDELAAVWGKGRTNGGKLHFDSDGMSGLSKYLPKEPVGEVRYHATRNLNKPVEQQNDGTSQKEFNRIFDEVYFHQRSELENRYRDYFVNDNSLTAYEGLAGCRFIYIKLYRKNQRNRS